MKDLDFSMRALPVTLAGFEPAHGDVRLVRALIVVRAPMHHPLADAGGELHVRGHMIQRFDEEENDEDSGYAGARLDVCPAVDGRDYVDPWTPALERVAAADRAAIAVALAAGTQP